MCSFGVKSNRIIAEDRYRDYVVYHSRSGEEVSISYVCYYSTWNTEDHAMGYFLAVSLDISEQVPTCLNVTTPLFQYRLQVTVRVLHNTIFEILYIFSTVLLLSYLF